MAVARHSENIEVQDGDQDDTNYENETTVTARRTNVEMSEGHYERLDLQKKDDAVYGDLRNKTRKDKGLPKKIRQSDRRPLRVVAVCLGMLFLISLGVNIAQAVLYRNIMTNDTLVHHYNTLKSNYDNKTQEFTRLKSDNTNLTQENFRLTTNYDALKQEKNQLMSDNANLTQEKDQLKSDNKNLMQEKNQLQNKSCCSSGWTTFADRCYYRTTKKTWHEGRDYCLNQGADLVVINSGEEQEFIRGLNRGSYSWIGLNRTEGRWTWVDGTPLTTQYWYRRRGYPDKDEDMNCAAYWHGTDPGAWINVLCSSTWGSICETEK